MDNDSYHSRQVNIFPSSTKAEIKIFMIDNINFKDKTESFRSIKDF